MTEFSFPWSCAIAGDGGPQSYTVEVVEATSRILGNVSPTTDGVVYWTDSTIFPGYTVAVDGLLLVEYMGAQIVRVHPGVGLVQGWLYFNAPDLGYPEFTVSGGAANATDIIGLRRDLVGQTVRLFQGRGPAGGTYSLVQTDAVWEIALAEIQLDGAGSYSSMTEVRHFVRNATNPPRESSLFIPCLAGENGTDNTQIDISFGTTGGLRSVPGILLPDSKVSGAWALGTLPPDVIGEFADYNDIDFRFLLWNSSTVTAGNVYYRMSITNYEDDGTTGFTDVTNWTTLNFPGGGARIVKTPYFSVVKGNRIFVDRDRAFTTFIFARDAVSATDTYSDIIHVVGVEIRYNTNTYQRENITLPVVDALM